LCAFVGTQNSATVMRDGRSNFGEGDIAAGVAERHDQNEGVGRQVGDDVGVTSGRGECGNVQSTCVGGRDTFAIWQAGNDGFVGWDDVGHRGSCGEKMAGGAGVEDGPTFDGLHVQLQSAKEGGGGKRIIVGGGWATEG
jgi:hypothetical protein